MNEKTKKKILKYLEKLLGIRILGQIFNRIFWDLKAEPMHKTWGKLKGDYDILNNIFKDILPSKILDIGCGSGRLFDLYKENDFINEVLAQDISKRALKIAEGRKSDKIILTNKSIKKIFKEKKNYFDLIISNRVLSAIPPQIINEYCKYLSLMSPKIYINEYMESDFTTESNYLFIHDYEKIFKKHSFEICKKGMLGKQTWLLFTR